MKRIFLGCRRTSKAVSGSWLGNSFRSVSYTHLDVYKRQGFALTKEEIYKRDKIMEQFKNMML